MEIIDTLLAIDPNYLLVGLIILFFVLETFFNRRERGNVGNKFKHLFHNFLFQLLAISIGSILGFMIVTTFDTISTYQLGLFNWIEVPYWFKVITGLFLLDLSDYWFHRWDHKIPLLWRQHRVHHSDTTMDASTALRQFPTELIYFTFGEMVISMIFGIDIMSMNLFLLIILPLFFLQHARLNYPPWTDKIFGWLLMTPNYHKFHHEQDQFFTDSNYGTIFIIWDMLFGTFKTKPVEEINYGLKEFEGAEKQSFWYQVRSPFINIKRIEDEVPIEKKI